MNILNIAVVWISVFCVLSSVYRGLVCGNDVARMLKMLPTSKIDFWIKQCFSSIAPLFKMRTSLKGKNAPRGSEFFPLRAVPYGIENHFHHIR